MTIFLSHPEARRVHGDVDDERDLVAALAKGDPAAFDRVYDAYHVRIFGFLRRLANRQDTAEDLAQETWLRFARAARTLAPDTKLASFLFTIARHAFLSHRRWAMLDLSRLVVFGFETTHIAEGPDAQHERTREMRLLEAALAKLPVASREVLLLVGVEGLDQEEAAKILGLSYEALRQRLSRARAQLQKKMDILERAASPAGDTA